jgi:hypothetical protein
VAGRPHADGDDVLSTRFEAERLVERQHPVDIAFRDVQVPGDAADGLGRDITKIGLHLMENVNEFFLLGPEFIENAVHNPSFVYQ